MATLSVYLTLYCTLHLPQIYSLWFPHAEHCTVSSALGNLDTQHKASFCNAMWLLLVTAEKGCRNVTMLSCKSKTYLGVCHRHCLFTNVKKRYLGCCGCFGLMLKEKLLMWTHNTNEPKTIKSEQNHTISKYTWPWAKLLLLSLFTNHCWNEQLLDVSTPKKKKKKVFVLMRKWPHFWLGCVHKLSKSLDLSDSAEKTSGITV